MKGGIIKKPEMLFCNRSYCGNLIPLKDLKKFNNKKTPIIQVKIEPETTKAIMEFLAEEKPGNRCRRCGHCCVVYMNIPLAKEEAAEELYAKKRRSSIHSKYRERFGLSEWVVMRAKAFDSELGREVFACVYWDPASRECLIFEDRPQVCREFDCDDKCKGYYVRAVWRALNEGMEMECLCA